MIVNEMLEDVKLAFNLLDTEENEQKFKFYWIACLTLLRAIGHVLKKVDSCDKKAEVAIRSWWTNLCADKTNHSIFWEFIEKERNFVLKEYEFHYEPNVILGIEDLSDETTSFFHPDGLYIPISSGYYEGEDCRDIIKEAIDWWEAQLNIIESNIK